MRIIRKSGSTQTETVCQRGNHPASPLYRNLTGMRTEGASQRQADLPVLDVR